MKLADTDPTDVPFWERSVALRMRELDGYALLGTKDVSGADGTRGRELTASFCRAHPAIARRFAEVTFTSDNRSDLAGVQTPTLVMQCTDDVIAPLSAGRFVHEHLPNSTFVQMAAAGHTPNLTAADETTRLIREYLRL